MRLGWALCLALATVAVTAACVTRPVDPNHSTRPSTPEPNQTSARSTPLMHLDGASDVILSMLQLGSFPCPGTLFEEVPEFTLFGDGRVIYERRHPTVRGLPDLGQAQLDEDAIQGILTRALDTAGLRTAKAEYRNDLVSDVEWTYFKVDAGGTQRNVAAYGLSTIEFEAPSGPDAQAIIRLAALAEDLRAWHVPVGSEHDRGAFDPQLYELELKPTCAFPDPNHEWPWDSLTLDDFAPGQDGWVRFVDAREAQPILRLNVDRDLVISAPDGRAYLVEMRPLLPDEEPLVE